MHKKEPTNQYDENGAKHGIWEQYNSKGELWNRINFDHGIKHGPYEWNYQSFSSPSEKGTYRHGKRHGPWKI